MSGNAEEKLVVGKNLGSFSGDRIVIGDDTPGTQPGLVLGKDTNNRAWLLWDVDNAFMAMGYRASGVQYNNQLTFQNGNVGIKTDNPSADFAVNGSICYTGSIGACSDFRYKRDIHTLSNALDKVSLLRGVTFEWKQTEYPEMNFPDQEQIGLVAQEVKEVVPQVVSETDDGYYNVDYSKLTALLVEAVKELKAENEELRARIDKLDENTRYIVKVASVIGRNFFYKILFSNISHVKGPVSHNNPGCQSRLKQSRYHLNHRPIRKNDLMANYYQPQ